MADKKMPRSNTRFPQRRPDHPRLQQQQVIETGTLGTPKKTNIFEITRGEEIEMDNKDKPYVKPLLN